MKNRILVFFTLLFSALVSQAHTINYTLDKKSDGAVFGQYLSEGFLHIIPLGLDHILFILCVFFLNTNLKQIILQASMFTLAHTITLGLSMYGIINAPAQIIEPIIALSIVFLAIENMYSDKVKPWRLIVVFIFGLVHGMGFAGALNDLGMPEYAFATALISFNIGVEIGQLAIILTMYFLVSRQFGKTIWYRSKLVIPTCMVIAAIAGYWTLERIFTA
jgi:hypothetical protein